MSRSSKNLDATALTQALGYHRLPAELTREGRVALLGEAFQALLDGRLPSREAALFLGGAGMAWLTNGGSLERQYLKVLQTYSRRTPSAIWQEIEECQHVRPDQETSE